MVISTDDGSLGFRGYVGSAMAVYHRANPIGGAELVVYTCGPEPMMEAVAEICHTATARCLVSLETPMACGIGICFSCVAKVRQADGGWDYKRTCVEGPVFDAEQIVW